MGFAASQARLILLTARKSDLEFRAQQITNAEMMLAMRSEEIANKYSRRISNQTAKIIDGNEEVAFDAGILASYGYTLCDGDGNPITTDMSLNTYTETTYSLNPHATIEIDGKEYTGKDLGLNTSFPNEVAFTNRYGNGISFKMGDETVTIDSAQIASMYIIKEEERTSYSGGPSGSEILEGVTRGNYTLLSPKGELLRVLDNSTGFVVSYDTSDDEAADAEYRRETAAIQVKEKRLQMEMKQVEAQQKACENEIESAKKLQDKNADSMFKYMS